MASSSSRRGHLSQPAFVMRIEKSNMTRASSFVIAITAILACVHAQSTTTPSVWPYQTFVSEPTLRPPVISINKTGETAAGHVVFAQSGAAGAENAGLIMTEDGQLLWNSASQMSTLTPFNLDGSPVLAYWTGVSLDYRGNDNGAVTILDDSYQVIYNVTLEDTDLQLHGTYSSLLNSHEVYITSYATLVGLSYDAIPFDLSPVGGPVDGWLRDGVVYEIDIKTNGILFKWRASDHIPITRSYDPRDSMSSGFGNSSDSAWDYVHLNAVSPFEGGYIVSARATFEAIYISNVTGEVIWRLQGEDGGDFQLESEGIFRWQHDIRLERYQGELLMHLHDNNNNNTPPYNATTGKLLKLDTDNKTATSVRTYTPSDERVQSSFAGSYQPVGNGNVFMYFGSQPVMKEFSSNGTQVLSYRFGPADAPAYPGVGSYRAFKSEWKGYPTTSPAISACQTSNGTVNVYMSWNGATETTAWNVYSGLSNNSLALTVGNVSKSGFETSTNIAAAQYVQAEAIGGCRDPDETRRSAIIAVENGCYR